MSDENSKIPAIESRVVRISKTLYVELTEALLPTERWTIQDFGRPNKVLTCYGGRELIFTPKET